MNTIKNFFSDETGLELTEYAVAAALIIAGLILERVLKVPSS